MGLAHLRILNCYSPYIPPIDCPQCWIPHLLLQTHLKVSKNEEMNGSLNKTATVTIQSSWLLFSRCFCHRLLLYSNMLVCQSSGIARRCSMVGHVIAYGYANFARAHAHKAGPKWRRRVLRACPPRQILNSEMFLVHSKQQTILLCPNRRRELRNIHNMRRRIAQCARGCGPTVTMPLAKGG